ncbi:MAG: putative circadian clock protein KaiC [Acidobacteriaceae bacterium]|nr:putative circadian clock protein KaiC [Acidobacteriaceae bacterium]
MTQVDRISTGIEGLDDILGGGIPKGHLYLVEGDPGTGKTTLALQFLMAGASIGEPVLYITLSESERELTGVAKSHKWSLKGVSIFELLPDEDSLRPEGQYTVFHPSEVELADTTRAVLDKVEELGAHRIVIDSLSELRMLARDSLRYRRQILAFKQYFAGRSCSVLLLDDRTGTHEDLQLQSIAHGVISMESLSREYGFKRRRLEVVKLRASAYREGFHDYSIKTGGISVYPRLIAAEHRQRSVLKKTLSGIAELDALWGGGVDRGTSTLVLGPAGCGKSTIATQYAIAAATRGERSCVFTFDESVPTLLARMKGLNLDAEIHLASGVLSVQQIDPAELSPGEFVSLIRQSVTKENATTIVIDSLNGLLNAMPGEQTLTMHLHELLTFLSQQGVSSFLVMAQHGLLGKDMISPVDVSYLADSVLLLRYFEAEGQVKQAISVVKKRTGGHERSIRELKLDKGIHVGKPLLNFRGVLTGVPEFLPDGWAYETVAKGQ